MCFCASVHLVDQTHAKYMYSFHKSWTYPLYSDCALDSGEIYVGTPTVPANRSYVMGAQKNREMKYIVQCSVGGNWTNRVREGWVWWHMLIISALCGKRPKDQGFKSGLRTKHICGQPGLYGSGWGAGGERWKTVKVMVKSNSVCWEGSPWKEMLKEAGAEDSLSEREERKWEK